MHAMYIHQLYYIAVVSFSTAMPVNPKQRLEETGRKKLTDLPHITLLFREALKLPGKFNNVEMREGER